METHGEGVGGEAGRIELRRLLKAIESSEVVEKRIPLIRQLEGSSHFSANDLGLILQGLLASWIDSTCSGVSHCTLHRSILQVALKCSDLDITTYLAQFLTLGSKASSWCGKHLKWSVKSIDQSQVVQEEEHDRLCLEINSLSFILSTKLLGIAAKCFTVLGLEVAAGEGAAQEECVLNKADDAFQTLETMAVEVEPVPAYLAVGATPWSLAPVLSAPTRKASRRCTHCGSEKTPRWLRGPDGPGTLCNACGQRFYKGRLLHSNSCRCQGHSSKKRRPSKENGHPPKKRRPSKANGHPSKKRRLSLSKEKGHPSKKRRPSKEIGHPSKKRRPSKEIGHPSKKRRTSKENSNDVAVLLEVPSENGHDMAMAPWSLASLPQEKWSRCTHCASEKSTRWHRGPDGPGTLCNACFPRFKQGRLLQSNFRRGSMENSAAGNDLVAALVEALPCDMGASLDAFFDQTEEAGPERAEEEEELEWLSNKDAFPSVETMAVEVEEVSAMGTCRQANVPPAEKETVVSAVLPRRRCTHCTTEKTPRWLRGPDGPYTLCNACGLAFLLNGRLLPEYRPTNSPGFSPQLHSNRYLRALEMHRQNEASANGPTSSPLQLDSSLRRVLEERRQSEEESSATGRATAEAGLGEVRHESMEVPLLPERPPADSPAFSLVSHHRVLKRRRKSERQTFAAIRATAKEGRAKRAAARLAAMDN